VIYPHGFKGDSDVTSKIKKPGRGIGKNVWRIWVIQKVHGRRDGRCYVCHVMPLWVKKARFGSLPMAEKHGESFRQSTGLLDAQ
jgi:hypothetical protein